MKQARSLYPLKFDSILKTTIWGGERICQFKHLLSDSKKVGESWEISAVKGNVSVVSNGVLAGESLDELIIEFGADLIGLDNFERFGTEFPLLVKFIDAADDLSIQVHPTDELAESRHHCKGKTEMWYVLDAAKGATLYAGFDQEITPSEYVQRVKDNTFTDVLSLHSVKKGDVFFLPAGAVHAIRRGTMIAEIQQTSDITYRIFDYNRHDAKGNGRELHVDLAKDAINYSIGQKNRVKYSLEKNEPTDLVSCPYFTTGIMELDEDMTLDYSELDSFVILVCVEGSCDVVSPDGAITALASGETLLIPACLDEIMIKPVGGVKLLETFV